MLWVGNLSVSVSLPSGKQNIFSKDMLETVEESKLGYTSRLSCNWISDTTKQDHGPCHVNWTQKTAHDKEYYKTTKSLKWYPNSMVPVPTEDLFHFISLLHLKFTYAIKTNNKYYWFIVTVQKVCTKL